MTTRTIAPRADGDTHRHPEVPDGAKTPDNRKRKQIPGAFTARRAIRIRCLDCMETGGLIESCPHGPDSGGNACALWPFRVPLQQSGVRGSRLKAIRKYCLWCMNGKSSEVRLCTADEFCALWPYRFGRRPKGDLKVEKPKRELSEKQKAAYAAGAERLRQTRKGKP